MNSNDLPPEILRLLPLYESGSTANIGEEFWDPCLRHCREYRRVAGFFSSTALITWASVLTRLAQSDAVQINLLISPILSKDDRDALAKVSTEVKRRDLLTQLSDKLVLAAVTRDDLAQDRALRQNVLLWMLATGKLEIRFGFPKHIPEAEDLHKKYGLFTFGGGQTVAFTGSANESLTGHLKNSEEVEVFKGWEAADSKRVAAREVLFDREWNGRVEALTVIGLSDKAIEQIRIRAPRSRPVEITIAADSASSTELARFMSGLWPHQLSAMDAFRKKKRGVVEMATGTGKTRVALSLLGELLTTGAIRSIVVSTGSVDLLRQWMSEIAAFLIENNIPLRVYRHFAEFHESERFIVSPAGSLLLISRSAAGKVLRNLDHETKQHMLIIYDEVHGLGSEELRRSLTGLSNDVGYVLGLSATPDREYDDDGNRFIEGHVGPTIYKYELSNAIQDGILSPFRYFPIKYVINDDDKQRLRSIYSRQAARKAAGNPMSQEELWTELARVYKTSEAKLPLFEDFIRSRREVLKRSIIFVETKEYGNKVLEIVHRYRDDFHTYYADDEVDVLRRFAHGDLHCLITCHKLSEGIDIRSLETVIMFSSARAKLETIQRIGRCLRRNPSDAEKIATIVDFVRERPDDDEEGGSQFASADDERMEWLKGLSVIRRKRDV